MLVPSLALILHVFSAIVWIGGMFFAVLVLRPASGPLDPGPRLHLWLRVLDRFFKWVIAAIVLLLVSGFTLVLGGYAGGPHVNLMMGFGIVMVLIFLHLSRPGSAFAPGWRPATMPRRRLSSTRSASSSSSIWFSG